MKLITVWIVVVLYNIGQYALATPRVEDDGPGGGGIEDNGGTFYRGRKRPPYAKYIRNGFVVNQDTQEKYSFTVRIINKKLKNFCGGVIISDQHILSSTSCVRFVSPDLSTDNITVQAGMLSLNDKIKDFQVQNIVCHNYYNKTYAVHDIAIIKLNQKINHADHLEPLQISWSFPVADLPVKIFGWGDGDALRYAQTYSISVAQCKLLLKETSDISPVKAHSTVGCLHHYLNKKIHSEPNDKGGPVVLNGTLIGILNDNYRTDMIDFFTKVAFYRTWILKNTKGVDLSGGGGR